MLYAVVQLVRVPNLKWKDFLRVVVANAVVVVATDGEIYDEDVVDVAEMVDLDTVDFVVPVLVPLPPQQRQSCWPRLETTPETTALLSS